MKKDVYKKYLDDFNGDRIYSLKELENFLIRVYGIKSEF